MRLIDTIQNEQDNVRRRLILKYQKQDKMENRKTELKMTIVMNSYFSKKEQKAFQMKLTKIDEKAIDSFIEASRKKYSVQIKNIRKYSANKYQNDIRKMKEVDNTHEPIAVGINKSAVGSHVYKYSDILEKMKDETAVDYMTAAYIEKIEGLGYGCEEKDIQKIILDYNREIHAMYA